MLCSKPYALRPRFPICISYFGVCLRRLGIPIRPMLATPSKGLTEVLDRFAGQPITCEFKYDGERAQVWNDQALMSLCGCSWCGWVCICGCGCGSVAVTAVVVAVAVAVA